MSLLNINLAIQGYLDKSVTANPMLKTSDFNYVFQGIPTDKPRLVPYNLAPGETQTFSNTTRTLSFSGSTSFSIVPQTGTSYARLQGAFGARTARVYGDGTTQWAVSLNNTTARLTWTGTGTAPTFGGISVGDGLTIEKNSAFSPANWGDFTVTNVGANYVEFQNPTAVGETQVATVAIYSSGPVQVGDILDLTDTHFSFVNQGQFTITRVTDTYVEFSNPNAVADSSITGVSNLNIYQSLDKWLAVVTDQRVIVRLNGDTGSFTEVEPITPGDIVNSPGLMFKRGKVFQVAIYNPGAAIATCLVFLSE